MNVIILGVGTLKEGYWKSAVAEFSKRLRPYCHLEIVECKESSLPMNASSSDLRRAVEEEGERLFARIPKRATVVSLCIEGEEQDSVSFSHSMRRWIEEGDGTVVFVIGGSDGLDEKIKQRSDSRLSFSRLTFPHQMMRVILLEQIYRAFRIAQGEPYHK